MTTEIKSTNLPKVVFGVEVSTQALFDAIIAERAAQRQGTHKVKTRGEVRGGGRKPYAQKHTGRARAGSTRSPIWVGGGTVWGPRTERNYELKVNRKVKRLAFNSALTLKANEGAVVVAEIKTTKPSTKELVKAIEALNLKKEFRKVLVVSDDVNTFKSGKNLPNVVVNKLSGLTVEMIVNADVIVLSEANIKTLEGMVK